jgi:hypothetical protein
MNGPFLPDAAKEFSPAARWHVNCPGEQRRREKIMNLYAVRRRGAWANAEELETTAATSARIGDNEMSDRVRWIRSYVISEPDGRLGTICIYQARDEASIREHAERVGMPGEEIEAIAKTVVIRPDPATGSEAAA